MKLALIGIAALSLTLESCANAPAQPAAKPTAAVPAAIVEVSGGKQVAAIGTPLDQPVVVQVNDAKGAPIAGVSVSFRGPNGAAFQPAAGVTGADGQFTTVASLGSIAGRYRITATAAKRVELGIEEIALGFEQNQGKLLNDVYCSRCHDQESTPERVSNFDNLTAKPHAFGDGAFLNKISDPDLLSIIQHGGQALGKSAQMPPYGRTLSKADVNALIAYIRAVADPPYRPKEIAIAQR